MEMYPLWRRRDSRPVGNREVGAHTMNSLSAAAGRLRMRALERRVAIAWLAVTICFGVLVPRDAHAVAAPEITIRGGAYSGSCHNTTYGVKAPIRLWLRMSGDRVFGGVRIAEPLYGSGLVEGTMEGGAIRFVTEGSDFGRIIWHGRVENNTVVGTYRCEDPGGTVQEGIWEASR